MLQNDLDAILARMSESGHKLHALDACGGSGNASLKLLKRNVNVTLCDISPELIEIFKKKCLKQGYTKYSTVCQEIGEYLSKTRQRFDLIVFSSALHHIEDYASILQLSAKRLKPKGFIYTVFDPIKWKFPTFKLFGLIGYFVQHQLIQKS
jgi:S-adenosylmethionine-dependent methyltransferase